MPSQRRPEQDQPRRSMGGGRDGITGMLSGDRALRAREVSRPTETDWQRAEEVVDQLVARAQGRRRH